MRAMRLLKSLQKQESLSFAAGGWKDGARLIDSTSREWKPSMLGQMHELSVPTQVQCELYTAMQRAFTSGGGAKPDASRVNTQQSLL